MYYEYEGINPSKYVACISRGYCVVLILTRYELSEGAMYFYASFSLLMRIFE